MCDNLFVNNNNNNLKKKKPDIRTINLAYTMEAPIILVA